MTEPELFREILERVLARYLTVTPRGVLIDGKPLDDLTVRILSFGAARTLYRARRPACRSLDGRKALNKETLCADCQERKHCTPQVRIDLVFHDQPFRLLLSFSSARNFLVHAAAMKKAGTAIENVATRIRILDRGSWGELRFSSPAPRATPSSAARPALGPARHERRDR
jgi:hypothetical protein